MKRLRLAWWAGAGCLAGAGAPGPGLAQSSLPPELPASPPGTYADPAAAAESLLVLVRRDSLDYEATWRLSQALVDQAKQRPERAKDPARDSLFERAREVAERAIALGPERAEGYFALANALGRAALTRPKTDRLRDARAIRDAATRALALDPDHDGAWHLLGRWHAEIMALPGFQRFLAKTLLGARVLGEASWEEAERSLERAVSLRPDWIYHRLDVAELDLRRGRPTDARAHLEAIAGLADRDVLDPVYRRRAAALLEELAGPPRTHPTRAGR